MASPAAAFHTAQRAALEASAGLPAAIGQAVPAIFTTVPTNVQPDYIVIGDDQVLDDSDDCAGSAEIFSTVHWWSRPSTLIADRARLIGAAIIAALNVQLTIDGHEVVEWRLEDERYNTNPDGSTHGLAAFRYLTTEIAESEA